MSAPKGPIGKDPWAAAPRTPGPLGRNDAADPETPDWFVGDTPGSLGHGDHADPNGQMCRRKPSQIEIMIHDLERRRQADCEKVKKELEEAHRIRDGYADADLLKQAKGQNWDGSQYDTKVAEKVFGKPAGQQATHVNPMFTNPLNCRITENWNLARYRKEGLPDIVYEADQAHEKVHKASCERLPSLQYNADMSFPEKLSKDEIKAYTAKIEVLERWLRSNSY